MISRRAPVRVLCLALCVLTLVLLPAVAVNAQQNVAPTLVLTDATGQYALDSFLEVLPDPTGRLTLDDVRQPAYAQQFRAYTPSYHLDFQNEILWLRLQLQNNSSHDDWLLRVNENRTGYLDIFRPARDGKTYTVKRSGAYLPFSSREIPNHRLIFSVLTPPDTAQTLYLRVESPLAYPPSFFILNPESLHDKDTRDLLVYGIFYGAMLILTIFYFCQFLILRDMPLLYLAFITLGFIFIKAAYDGLGQQFFWPAYSNQWTFEYSVLATLFAISLLSTSFLNVSLYVPRLKRGFQVWWVVLFVCAMLVPFLNTLPLILFLVSSLLLLVILASGLAWRNGFLPARLFLLTGFFPIAAGITYVLYSIGFIPFSFLESHLALVSLTALSLFWSIVLAGRIRSSEKRADDTSRELVQTEAKYRALFQSSKETVFVMDRHGKLLDLNPAGMALLGLTQDTLKQVYLPDLTLTPQEKQAIIQELEEKGFISNQEVQMRSGDKRVITLLFSANTWQDAKHALSGYQGTLRDITDQRLTQQELTMYRLHLEELVAARTAQARTELAEREMAEAALEQRVQELSALYEMTKTINSVTDLMPALELVAARLTKLLNLSALTICELSPTDHAFSLLVRFPRNVFVGMDDKPNCERIPFLASIIANPNPLVLDAAQNQAEIRALKTILPPLPFERVVAAPLRLAGNVNGLMLLGAVSPSKLGSDENIHFIETVAGAIATAIENMHLFYQAQTTAVADERQRLARELHDSVTQLLYSIVLLAGGWGMQAEQTPPDKLAAISAFNELAELGQQALSEMRLLLYQLRSPLLTESGLKGTLQQRLNAVEERVGIHTQLFAVGDIETLPLNLRQELYWIAQEALNNALRHAHATTVRVDLIRKPNSMEMIIRDDGTGFDTTQNYEGMGLKNLASRAQMIDARLEIHSTPDNGTQVQIAKVLNMGKI